MEEEPNSILNIHGSHSSRCGYCSSTSSSVSIGATPLQLSCSVYQKMVDRGWRRSGQYVYKPTMIQTCCPQYPIRLDAMAFEPTRSHRKALYRFNRFVIHGNINDDQEGPKDESEAEASPEVKVKPPKPKPRKQVFSLIDSIHEPEAAFQTPDSPSPRHKLEVTIEQATYTEEKFNLFQDYQTQVHHDDDSRPGSFKRFLCDTDLVRTKIPYAQDAPSHLPTHYGTHHQLYRLDGELIAMSVLDILPGCVSGVYFMYSTPWAWCQLGKLSVLREASIAREMRAAGLADFKWVYLGYYIHSCQKMRYKGDYSPSYLMDPESYEWFPLKDCKDLLDKFRYACFSSPSHSIQDLATPNFPDLKQADLVDVYWLQTQSQKLIARPFAQLPVMHWKWLKTTILQTLHELGPELSKEIFFEVD